MKIKGFLIRIPNDLMTKITAAPDLSFPLFTA